MKLLTEAVVRRCFVKKVFLEILENSKENTCARVFNFIKEETLAQVFFCEFCEISKNNFFYRTPQVAAFVLIKWTQYNSSITIKSLH